MKHQKRLQILTKRKFQISLMCTSLFYVLSTIVILGATLFVPLAMDLYNPQVDIAITAQVAEKILYIDKNFWSAIFFLVPLICFHSIITTHKIAGPLQRYKDAIDKLIRGDLTQEFSLRTDDYLKELESVNELKKQYRSIIEDIQTRNKEINQSLETILSDPKLDNSEKYRQEIQTTYLKSTKLTEKMSFFKV